MLYILSSATFPVEKVSEVDSNLPATDIVVRIAAGIKAYQFKPLMKIEPDSICIAGLRLQYDGTPVLTESNFLCFIHQLPSDAFSTKRITHP